MTFSEICSIVCVRTENGNNIRQIIIFLVLNICPQYDNLIVICLFCSQIYTKGNIAMNCNIKMLIGSQNAVGTEIASELSRTGIYAVTRRNFSSEMLETNNVVLIDNTKDDMDETLESLILSGKTGARIFVLTSDTEPLISDKNGVLFMSEKLGTESICGLIRYSLDVENSRKQAEKAISKALLYLGFQAHFRGYRYSIEGISLIIENPEFSYSFNHKIYSIIAKNHGVTPASVERAVRNSIESAYDRNYRKFEEFFGYPIQKPTNTEFISFCAEKIRLELF